MTALHFNLKFQEAGRSRQRKLAVRWNAVRENVVLVNDRGVTVSFWYCQGALGGYSHDVLKAQISQADTSDFVPGYPWGTDRDCSELGEFMVARIHITGEMMAGIDDDYVPVDSMMFAVIPTSRLGEVEFAGQAWKRRRVFV